MDIPVKTKSKKEEDVLIEGRTNKLSLLGEIEEEQTYDPLCTGSRGLNVAVDTLAVVLVVTELV